jgi:arylformamidase
MRVLAPMTDIKYWLLAVVSLLVWSTASAAPTVVRDLAYGTDAAQRFDVYVPAAAKGAPIVLMVHGGAWQLGDKQHARSIQNKLSHWTGQGLVFVSTNYRMLPAADPLAQARDVALALAAVQARAADWGGDGTRVVLMGHSAGAHLVALVATDPALRSLARPWLATISLDTASLDVEATMRGRHLPLYDRAFGEDRDYWRRASPFAQLDRGSGAFLLVCSTRRQDSCPQGEAFAARARGLALRAETLAWDFSHAGINEQLGLHAGYTAAVDRFLASLDAVLAEHLKTPARRPL